MSKVFWQKKMFKITFGGGRSSSVKVTKCNGREQWTEQQPLRRRRRRQQRRRPPMITALLRRSVSQLRPHFSVASLFIRPFFLVVSCFCWSFSAFFWLTFSSDWDASNGVHMCRILQLMSFNLKLKHFSIERGSKSYQSVGQESTESCGNGPAL